MIQFNKFCCNLVRTNEIQSSTLIVRAHELVSCYYRITLGKIYLSWLVKIDKNHRRFAEWCWKSFRNALNPIKVFSDLPEPTEVTLDLSNTVEAVSGSWNPVKFIPDLVDPSDRNYSERFVLDRGHPRFCQILSFLKKRFSRHS